MIKHSNIIIYLFSFLFISEDKYFSTSNVWFIGDTRFCAVTHFKA